MEFVLPWQPSIGDDKANPQQSGTTRTGMGGHDSYGVCPSLGDDG